MARSITWVCDTCQKESRIEGDGWINVKEFHTALRPRFYAFCSWNCLTNYSRTRGTNKRPGEGSFSGASR